MSSSIALAQVFDIWKHRILKAALIVALGITSSLHIALAQDDDIDPALLDEVRINISRIQIEGDNPLKASATRKLFSDLTGDDQSLDNIRQATERLEKLLRAKGYSFYRVVAPPQDLTDGVVRINITRFRLDSITVQGNAFFSDANIRRSLPSLVADASPNTRKLARYLAVANNNPSKNTRVTVAKGKEKEKIDVVIKVVDYKPISLTAYLNNTGNDTTGNSRLGLGVQHNNLFDRDHIVSATLTTSPEGLDTVKQIGLNYQIPLYYAGATLSFFGIDSNIDSGTVAEVFEVSGSGKIFGLKYTQFLPKWKEYKQSLSVQVSDKLYDNDIDFLGSPIGVDVRSRPLAVRYQIERSFKNRKLTAFAEYIDNLSGGSKNTLLAYRATRSGASPDWNSWQLGTTLTQNRKRWTYVGRLSATGSSDRLITGEQGGVGGSNSVRGFEEREYRGDKSVRASFQVWAPASKHNLRVGAFIDYGKVKINDPEDGERPEETIASTGLNMVWQSKKNLFVRASVGYVLDGGESEDDLSQDGDTKIHVSVGKRW